MQLASLCLSLLQVSSSVSTPHFQWLKATFDDLFALPTATLVQLYAFHPLHTFLHGRLCVEALAGTRMAQQSSRRTLTHRLVSPISSSGSQANAELSVECCEHFVFSPFFRVIMNRKDKADTHAEAFRSKVPCTHAGTGSSAQFTHGCR